jgi:hypothetical protein
VNIEKRVEVFIHIREKIDEIFEVIKANKLDELANISMTMILKTREEL